MTRRWTVSDSDRSVNLWQRFKQRSHGLSSRPASRRSRSGPSPRPRRRTGTADSALPHRRALQARDTKLTLCALHMRRATLRACNKQVETSDSQPMVIIRPKPCVAKRTGRGVTITIIRLILLPHTDANSDYDSPKLGSTGPTGCGMIVCNSMVTQQRYGDTSGACDMA